MKRCLLPKGVAAALFAVSVLNGCNEGTENLQYVNLSQAACSFLGEDNTPLTITVDASPATWQATPNASWIKAERTDEHTLTLTADANDTDQERKTTVTIQADRATQTIRINQLPKDSFFARYRKLDEFASSAMSPGGKYAGGYIISVAPDDSWQYSPVIIDVETEERYEFGPFPESLYFISQTIAITDQGLMFLSNSNGGQIAINTTGDIIVPEAPAGFQFQPEVQGSSADGRYWVGFAKESNGEEGLTWPLLWTDGVAEKLPMPAKNFRDEAFWYGIMARGISADGSVIYGTTWENLDFGMVYWKRDGGEWKVDYVGQDVHEIKPVKMLDAFGEEMDYNLADGIICTAEYTKISATGKWIAGSYRIETLADNRMDIVRTQYAAFYNTETETTTVVKDYGGSVGIHVTDDGIAFIGLGTMNLSSGVVYDLNTNTELGSVEEWVHDTYGIYVPTGYINSVSPDGRVIFGTMLDMTGTQDLITIGWYVAPPAEA